MLLAINGKQYGHAGLQDILVKTEIVSARSVDGVLSSKHYNRAVHVQWSHFEQHLNNAQPAVQIDPTAFKKLLCNVFLQSVANINCFHSW